MIRIKNTDRKFLERWELHRSSKWKFILIHGVIYWGIPTWLLSSLTNILFEDKTIYKAFEHWYCTIFVWLLGGLLFGWLLWRSSENKYRQLKNEQENQND